MNKNNIKFILSMLIFGFNGILVTYIPWHSYEIVLSRTVIGSLSMLLILAFQRKKLVFFKNKKSLKMLILSGILIGLNWLFLYEAFKQLGVGLAQILSSSGPAVAMILSPLIFNEKLKKHKIIAFIIVVLGMFLISSNDLSGGLSFGLLCGILACLAYAGFLICNRLATSIEGPERTMWQLFIASIVVLIFIIYKGNGIPNDLSLKTVIAVLILGIVNTGLAMNLMFSSLPKLSLQTVGIYTYLEPMSALVFSFLILGEKMTILEIVGVFMILGGTIFSEMYSLKKN